MNVNMNMMDSSPHPFNQPSASSTAPYATISSATAPTTAAHPPSDPLLFSSTSARTTISNNTNTTLNLNPHHAPADPLHHLQQQQPHTAETGPSGLAPAVAAAAVAAESQASVPAPAPASGPTATAPFLRDFSLVAEAAKRAQMSVVMRDLESVTL